MDSTILGQVAFELAALAQAKGVAPDAINAYESANAVDLPQALEEFFAITGADYDYLFGGGTRANFAELGAIRDDAVQTLDECGTTLTRPYFPILSFAGDQFIFVYLDEGDDPPVYRFEVELFDRGDRYIAGWSSLGLPNGVMRISPSFSAMVRELVDERGSMQA